MVPEQFLNNAVKEAEEISAKSKEVEKHVYFNDMCIYCLLRYMEDGGIKLNLFEKWFLGRLHKRLYAQKEVDRWIYLAYLSGERQYLKKTFITSEDGQPASYELAISDAGIMAVRNNTFQSESQKRWKEKAIFLLALYGALLSSLLGALRLFSAK